MAVRTHSWFQFRALLLALAALGFLRAQKVVVLEPGNLIFTPATVQFTAVIDGGPEEPVVWSVVRGPGTIDPASGLYQAIETPPEGFGAVTVRATLVSRPDVSGEGAVMLVGPRVASLLSEGFRKRLIDHGSGWLSAWMGLWPFNDPATGAPPPGSPGFPETEETPYTLRAYGKTWSFNAVVASYGFRRPLWFDHLEGGRSLFAYGNPRGLWTVREVKGPNWVRFTPFPDTTTLTFQTTRKTSGAYQTRRVRVPVFVMGVAPFAGRHLNPGNDDGQGPRARFMRPSGLAMTDPGPDEWRALVSDEGANTLRLVDPAGTVKTYAGAPDPGLVNGPCRDARFRGPTFMLSARLPPTDKEHVHGDWITFVADTGNNVIRCIQKGLVYTFAGTGHPGSHDADAAHASFDHPRGLAMDHSGNLYVADSGNFVVRRIDARPPHAVTTIAGTPGTRGTLDAPAGRDAQFWDMKGLLLLQGGERLALVDGNAIRSIHLLGSREVSTLLGRPDTPGYQDLRVEPGSPSLLQPCLRDPWSLMAVGHQGLLIADEGNHAVREFVQRKGEGSDAGFIHLATIAGDPSLSHSRPGFFRGDGTLPPGKFRQYFAALGAPRSLLYLGSSGPGAMKAPSALVTDGSALSRILHFKAFPVSPPPRLEVPATTVAGKPFTIRLRLQESKPDGRWPGGPYECSLDLLDREDAEPLERLDFTAWATETKELTLTVKEPGAYTVRLVAMDASANQFPMASAHVQVVAEDLGGTAAPAPAQTPAPAVPPVAAPAKAPQKPSKKKKKKKKASGKQPSSLPAPGAQAAQESVVEDPDDLEPQESKEAKADEDSPKASRAEPGDPEEDRGDPFTLVRTARGSLLLARQGFKLRPLALQHIRERHIEACRDDDDERTPGRFSAAYGGSDDLRTLLAEGLARENRLEERPGQRAGRYEFLCRKAKVGTVTGAGGTETATDFFKVVAYQDQDDNFWHIITAYPVRAPGAGTP